MESAVGDSISPGPVSTTRPGVSLTDAGLVLMATIWAVNYSVLKYGTGLVGPLAFNGLRMTIASVALVAIVQSSRQRWPPLRTALTLMALGVLGNGAYQLLFIEGIARTRAADAALVVSASPAMIALIGRIGGVERLPARAMLGIGLSISGIALVVYGSRAEDSGTATLVGDLLVLGGSVCWAFYSVWLKPYTHAVSGIQLSALTMVGGTIPLVAVASHSLVTAQWRAMPTLGWLAVAYSGLVALVFAYLLWYRGLRVLGPTRAAVYGNIQPVVAVLVAWAVLSETPTAWQVGGTACIVSGLLLTRA